MAKKGRITRSKKKTTQRSKKKVKDISVLHLALGKAIFEQDFRKLIFRDPDFAAKTIGVDRCVIDGILELGEKPLNGFAKKYSAKIKKAAADIIFCYCPAG